MSTTTTTDSTSSFGAAVPAQHGGESETTRSDTQYATEILGLAESLSYPDGVAALESKYGVAQDIGRIGQFLAAISDLLRRSVNEQGTSIATACGLAIALGRTQHPAEKLQQQATGIIAENMETALDTRRTSKTFSSLLFKIASNYHVTALPEPVLCRYASSLLGFNVTTREEFASNWETSIQPNAGTVKSVSLAVRLLLQFVRHDTLLPLDHDQVLAKVVQCCLNGPAAAYSQHLGTIPQHAYIRQLLLIGDVQGAFTVSKKFGLMGDYPDLQLKYQVKGDVWELGDWCFNVTNVT